MQEAYVPRMYLVNCIALHESLLSSVYKQPAQCLEDHRFDILSGTQDFSLSFARDRMIFNFFLFKNGFHLWHFLPLLFFFHSLITHDLYLSVLTTSIPSNSIPLQYSYTSPWWRYSSLYSLGFDGDTAHYNPWDLVQMQLTILPGIWCINNSQDSLGFDGNRVKYTYCDFIQIQLALIPGIWCKYS